MYRLKSWIVLLLASVNFAPAESIHLCTGIIEENDLQIPVSAQQEGGINSQQFHELLDRLENYYRPIVQARGGVLQINRDWNSPTVNASAQRIGNRYRVNMFGGLARHQLMTADAFIMVGCHEIGHHLAGAPKINDYFSNWASNEGAADYFANLRCMRIIYSDSENLRWASEKSQEIDPILRQKCEEIFTNQADENICMRMGMAGYVGAKFFQIMRKETTEPRFDTPDPNQVSQTFDGHPATQCRLDTYYQGGLCAHDQSVELSDQNPVTGTCTAQSAHNDGLRPRCWFKP